MQTWIWLVIACSLSFVVGLLFLKLWDALSRLTLYGLKGYKRKKAYPFTEARNAKLMAALLALAAIATASWLFSYYATQQKLPSILPAISIAVFGVAMSALLGGVIFELFLRREILAEVSETLAEIVTTDKDTARELFSEEKRNRIIETMLQINTGNDLYGSAIQALNAAGSRRELTCPMSKRWTTIAQPQHSLEGWKQIPIQECGEALVSLRDPQFRGRIEVSPQYYLLGIKGAIDDCLVRENVAKRLLIVARQLPSGLRLVAWDTWRPHAVQKALFDKYLCELRQEHPYLSLSDLETRAASFVSLPSSDPRCPFPHSTGGAVDLSIITEQSVPLEMGTDFDDFSIKAHTRYYEDLFMRGPVTSQDRTFRRNRRLLHSVMTNAGFASYPYEWWHYDYGDQFWAALTKADAAKYGNCDTSTNPPTMGGQTPNHHDRAEGGQMPIDVILVQDSTESSLKLQLESGQALSIMATYTTNQIKAIPQPAGPIPEVLIVINAESMNRDAAVMSGLILRNVGHQVFITTPQDYDDLEDLIADTFAFLDGLEDRISPIRTEVLVTEHAMELLGDISATVECFEREFLIRKEE
jgi:zinc D-Ala-D-Ala dipeptidase